MNAAKINKKIAKVAHFFISIYLPNRMIQMLYFLQHLTITLLLYLNLIFVHAWAWHYKVYKTLKAYYFRYGKIRSGQATSPIINKSATNWQKSLATNYDRVLLTDQDNLLLSLQMFYEHVLFKHHAGWTFHECIKHYAR